MVACLLISKKKDLSMNIDIQGNTVTLYKSIKLLGVNIDCQLIFRDHISEVCKRVIMRLRNMIPTAAKLQLYKAAILPYLTYCMIWHYIINLSKAINCG
jgi:hypothetical protein